MNMPNTSAKKNSALRDNLRSAFERSGMIAEEGRNGRYEVDFTGDHRGQALAVMRPRSTEEVVEITKWCHKTGAKLVPQGGHTGLVAGGTPTSAGNEIILSLERMNSVREINAQNGVAVVDAGCILANAKRAVEDAGSFLPISIGSEGSCQIGGVISTNAGGINVVRYGMARNHVLGLEVVLPDGQIFHDLSRLHKNNLGYDLKQMFIGAEGTLGTITAASLKLSAKPSQTETLMLALPSAAAVIELFHRFRQDAGDFISAFELMLNSSVELVCSPGEPGHNPFSRFYPAYAIIEMSICGGPPLKPWLETYLEELMGDIDILDGVVAQNGTQVDRIWALREGIVESQSRFGRYLRTDVSMPISDIDQFIHRGTKAIDALVPGAQIHPYGHVGDGNLHCTVLRPLDMAEEVFEPMIKKIEDLLFDLVEDYQGSISAEHGIGISKREAFKKTAPLMVLHLMHGLKGFVDPTNMMAPGRILSTRDGNLNAP